MMIEASMTVTQCALDHGLDSNWNFNNRRGSNHVSMSIYGRDAKAILFLDIHRDRIISDFESNGGICSSLEYGIIRIDDERLKEKIDLLIGVFLDCNQEQEIS